MTQPGEDSGHDAAAGDLAFLRALVTEGPKAQGTAGTIFLAAGTIYGLDCLVYWAQSAFSIPFAPFMWPFLSVFPAVAVLAVIAWVAWRDRKDRQQGVATRALTAAYMSAGLANLVIALAFGWVAIAQKNMLIWLLYPVVICAFLGAVWYVAYIIQRKLWLAGVSAGWFATTVALGLLVRQTQPYLLVLGLALIVLMGGTGYVMVSLDRRQKKEGA